MIVAIIVLSALALFCQAPTFRSACWRLLYTLDYHAR